MKKCCKCKIEKELNNFGKCKSNKDGYTYSCKLCRKEDSKKYRNNLIKKDDEFYLNNENNKICLKCKEDKSIINFDKQKDKKDGFNNYCKLCRKKSHEENRDIILIKRKEYRNSNPEKIKEQKIYYNSSHKEHIKSYMRNYDKTRRSEDNLYKLSSNIKSLIRISMKGKGYSKNTSTFNILGCTYEFFLNYLESKFENWMSWDNYGLYNGILNHGWDIDHIIPSSSALNEEEMIKLNHYTNLQPLCSLTNRYIKRDK